MIKVCIYVGQTPIRNSMCNSCELFLETFIPIASTDGYSLGSECDAYFCPTCEVENCAMKELVNL